MSHTEQFFIGLYRRTSLLTISLMGEGNDVGLGHVGHLARYHSDFLDRPRRQDVPVIYEKY